MANTTNFGWETPDDTDLVKDGALAMRTLGNAIDTSLVDLKGGTTGQVLSKNSNSDMDFTWVTSDDANAIQNAIVDAKGDLITATAADTPARLAVGSNGDTLVADSAATTGLRWQGNFAAGKNYLINGDFRINQRNFTSNTTSDSYNFDRWAQLNSGGTVTVTPQTFTLGTAPVVGYEARNFVRIVSASQSTNTNYAALIQRIESVRTLANQTATISFWAKASTGTPNVGITLEQAYGSGGSPSATTTTTITKQTITSSWARYSFTVNIPSISGKTLGTNNNDSLNVLIFTSCGSGVTGYSTDVGLQNVTIDFWGVQVEAGSVATAFQTATGTLQGELAACQRYFERQDASLGSTFAPFGVGACVSTTQAYNNIYFTQKRTNPSLSFSSAGTFAVTNSSYAAVTVTAISSAATGLTGAITLATVASGLVAGNATQLYRNASGAAFIDISAEL